jgi:hypothetical protein
MCVAFFSTKSEDEGRQILGLIKHSVPDTRVKILRTLVGLLGSLKNFPSPDIALLVVADQAELSSVLSMKKSLQNSRVILILPDRSEASLRLSLALSPLLICFRDSDFSEVVTLLARLKREKRAKIGEIDPIRYGWSGELPCISSPYVIDDFESDQLPDELPFFA